MRYELKKLYMGLFPIPDPAFFECLILNCENCENCER